MAQADADAELQFQQQQQQQLHDDDGDESPDPDDGGPEIDFSGMGGMGGVGSTGGGATDMPGSYGGGGSGGDDGEESGDDDGPEIHWEGYVDLNPRLLINLSQRTAWRATTNNPTLLILLPLPDPAVLCVSRHSPFHC